MKPEDGYIAYIINPKSGASTGEKLPGWRFEEYLTGRGFEVRMNLTRSLEHACELASDAAADDNCAMVVAVGGDGTIREVAHGLEGSDKPLLIVPGGTENLLANELGLEKSLATLTKTFEAGFTRDFDLGNANGRCFTSIAGFGFDGEVVAEVSRNRIGHINYFDYFWPIWRTFWRYRFDPITVEVDGERIFDGRGLVFVGNISRYAMGLNILEHADYSDGLLDVCVYKCSHRMHLVKHSLMTIFSSTMVPATLFIARAKISPLIPRIRICPSKLTATPARRCLSDNRYPQSGAYDGSRRREAGWYQGHKFCGR